MLSYGLIRIVKVFGSFCGFVVEDEVGVKVGVKVRRKVELVLSFFMVNVMVGESIVCV